MHREICASTQPLLLGRGLLCHPGAIYVTLGGRSLSVVTSKVDYARRSNLPYCVSSLTGIASVPWQAQLRIFPVRNIGGALSPKHRPCLYSVFRFSLPAALVVSPCFHYVFVLSLPAALVVSPCFHYVFVLSLFYER